MYRTVKCMFVIMLASFMSFSCKNAANPAAPVAASIFYNFDTSMEGWNNNGLANETLSINTDVNYIKAGAGSVKCACSLSKTGPKAALLYKTFVSSQNLTNTTVSIWIYVPVTLAASGYRLDLNMQRASQTNIDTFYSSALSTAGWNNITYTIPSYSTNAGNVTCDYSGVQMMYFIVENIDSASADWSGDIYFDELSW